MYNKFATTIPKEGILYDKMIPDSLKTQPVFFCIDDTMVQKFGQKFEDVSKL